MSLKRAASGRFFIAASFKLNIVPEQGGLRAEGRSINHHHGGSICILDGELNDFFIFILYNFNLRHLIQTENKLFTQILFFNMDTNYPCRGNNSNRSSLF